MKLRNCAYPEPSHIHVPRPSRSETNLKQLAKTETDEHRLLAETVLADHELCFTR